MKVEYKKANTHILPVGSDDGKAHVREVRIVPGVNEIADKDWAKLSLHPMVKAMIDAKILVPAAEKEDKAAKKKADK